MLFQPMFPGADCAISAVPALSPSAMAFARIAYPGFAAQSAWSRAKYSGTGSKL